MRITTLVSAAAIALAATIGSVSAADQFATLDGVTANQMTSSELAAVKGMHIHFFDANGVIHLIPAPRTLDNGSADGGLVIQAYNGLCVAGPISIPNVPSQCP